MLCPPPPTLNPVTIFEAARLPHRANPSRAAGSFSGHTFALGFGRCAPNPAASAMWVAARKWTLRKRMRSTGKCHLVISDRESNSGGISLAGTQ
jgi:hypothetical protein